MAEKNIKYSENDYIDLNEYANILDNINKYYYFELKDIIPKKEIKIEINFIKTLEI